MKPFFRLSTLPLILLLCCLTNIRLIGQNASIFGTISNEKELLPYASVFLKGQNRGTTSDETGAFRLDGLSAGTYTLTASYVGYANRAHEVTLAAGEQLRVDFVLPPAEELEAVVVTGTLKPTYVSDSPIKVDVITAKQLDTYIPAAASSVVEGIQLVNGVQEVVACGVCYTNNISINGLQGAYTAVLMDGTPMFGNLASVYGLNGIPNMIIDRFEVIKGPSSTLYGSEAVAGVINIITKDPAKQPLLSVDLMGTSRGEHFGNLAIAPKLGKTSGYIGLNYAYDNDFQDFNADHFGDAILLDRYSLFTKWNIGRKSGKKFTLAGKYYYEDRRNGLEDYVRDRAYRDLRGSDRLYGESIYTNRWEVLGTYELDTAAKLRLDFSLSHHDQDSYYGSDHYEAQQRIGFANFLWNIDRFEQHDILVGLTNRYQYYDDNTVATQGDPINGVAVNAPDNQYIPGIFVQDEYTLSPKWTVLGGARLDHYESHGPIFAPRLNVKFKPSDWTTIRTNFGTGFRIVNLFTEDHAFVTGQRSVEILETLNPERSYNASLNLNHIYSGLGGAGNFDIEAYYTYFNNKILPDYDTPGKIIYANSDGHAQTLGIGLNLNHNFVFPLSFNLGVNLQSVTQTEPNAEGVHETSHIEFAPQWSGVLTANYNWKKAGLVVAYTVRVTGTMALPVVFDLDENGEPLGTSRATQSEPFSIHNLQITKTFNEHWSLYGGVQNLLNFRQTLSPLVGVNDPNAAIGFSPYFDTSYAYAPNQGRALYLGLQWNW